MDEVLKEFQELDVPESMCNETKLFVYTWLKAKFTSHNKDCAVPHPSDATPKSCATCNSKGMDAYECYCCKQNGMCYYEAQDFAQS